MLVTHGLFSLFHSRSRQLFPGKPNRRFTIKTKAKIHQTDERQAYLRKFILGMGRDKAFADQVLASGRDITICILHFYACDFELRGEEWWLKADALPRSPAEMKLEALPKTPTVTAQQRREATEGAEAAAILKNPPESLVVEQLRIDLQAKELYITDLNHQMQELRADNEQLRFAGIFLCIPKKKITCSPSLWSVTYCWSRRSNSRQP
jgi:hypothetical protein